MAEMKGKRVLDFTHLFPGEICAALLCELGADVTRIESPTPGLAHRLPPLIHGESLYYWSMQRNKSRILINLKNSDSLAVTNKLLVDADIVIENFRPGVMDRLGLGYESANQLNPGIIYCSISGYGQNSEKSNSPVHDLNLAAETGLLQLNCRQGERPVLPPVPFSDFMAGMLATISIQAALAERSSSGRGRHLDISMLDSCFSALNIACSVSRYKTNGPQGKSNTKTKHNPISELEMEELSYPREFPNYRAYQCSDGRFLAVACLEHQFWERFCQLIEKPEFIPLIDQAQMHPQLESALENLIITKPLSHWRKLFSGSDCCVSPVNTVEEALMDLGEQADQLFFDLAHPRAEIGMIPQMLFPIDRSLRSLSD